MFGAVVGLRPSPQGLQGRRRRVIDAELPVVFAHEQFDEAGGLLDDDVREALRGQLATLVEQATPALCAGRVLTAGARRAAGLSEHARVGMFSASGPFPWRSPGVFFGYALAGTLTSSAVERIRCCSALCAAGSPRPVRRARAARPTEPRWSGGSAGSRGHVGARAHVARLSWTQTPSSRFG